MSAVLQCYIRRGSALLSQAHKLLQLHGPCEFDLMLSMGTERLATPSVKMGVCVVKAFSWACPQDMQGSTTAQNSPEWM